jgi:hypothetical protein
MASPAVPSTVWVNAQLGPSRNDLQTAIFGIERAPPKRRSFRSRSDLGQPPKPWRRSRSCPIRSCGAFVPDSRGVSADDRAIRSPVRETRTRLARCSPCPRSGRGKGQSSAASRGRAWARGRRSARGYFGRLVELLADECRSCRHARTPPKQFQPSSSDSSALWTTLSRTLSRA